MKLKNVYVTWKKGEVEVVAKSDGVPKGVDNYFDPDCWDQSNPAHLLFQWFTILTCGQYDIRKMNNPSGVYEAFEQIDEFEELLEGTSLRQGTILRDGDKDRELKLKDIYVVWEDGKLDVVPRSNGKPPVRWEDSSHSGGSLDPDEWDQSNIAHLYLKWTDLLSESGIKPKMAQSKLLTIEEFAIVHESYPEWTPKRKAA